MFEQNPLVQDAAATVVAASTRFTRDDEVMLFADEVKQAIETCCAALGVADDDYNGLDAVSNAIVRLAVEMLAVAGEVN